MKPKTLIMFAGIDKVTLTNQGLQYSVIGERKL